MRNFSRGMGFLLFSLAAQPLFTQETAPTASEGSNISYSQTLSQNPHLNPIPAETLAFPPWSENYKTRMHGSYEIWSEEKLNRWMSAQGLAVSSDSPGAGLLYHRAAVLSSPGITFKLRRPITEKGSAFANGWTLNLDIAALRNRHENQKTLPYNNLLECEVWIDGEFYETIRQGGKSLAASPVKIDIPHIRDAEGWVSIELKVSNHPRNFLFLYDAYLSRRP